MRCCRNLSRAVLQKAITCGAAETCHVRCCRNLSRCGVAETCHGAVLPKRTRFIPKDGIYVSTFVTTEHPAPGGRHNDIRDARPSIPRQYTSQRHNTICILTISRRSQQTTRLMNTAVSYRQPAALPAQTASNLVNGEQQIPLRP